MSEKVFFDGIKDSIEKAKASIISVEGTKRTIEEIVSITDDYDKIDDLFDLTDKLAQLVNSKNCKVFIYDLIDNIRAKLNDIEITEIIKSFDGEELKLSNLREKGVIIITSKYVDEILEELKFILQNYNKSKNLLIEEHNTKGEVETEDSNEFNQKLDVIKEKFQEKITVLFSKLPVQKDREVSLDERLTKLIQEVHPQLIYINPPLLEKRDGTVKHINFLTERVLKGKPNGTWAFFKAKYLLTPAKKITFLVLGGQDIKSIIQSSYAALTLIANITVIPIECIVLIDEKKLNLATLVMDSSTDVKAKIEQKLIDEIEYIRIKDRSIKIKVVFGEIESELGIELRKSETQVVFITPKLTKENTFDEEILDASMVALTEGISVFYTF
jgi:hypothetical protein